MPIKCENYFSWRSKTIDNFFDLKQDSVVDILTKDFKIADF